MKLAKIFCIPEKEANGQPKNVIPLDTAVAVTFTEIYASVKTLMWMQIILYLDSLI